jgi:hypothetical protein
MEQLSRHAHPARGIRFTPYAYVTPRDLVFSPARIRTLLADTTRHFWGEYDGTGDPIMLTFSEYFDRFVYSRDFASSQQISQNRRLGHGNSLDNSAEFYPGSRVVEFYIPGTNPRYEGMDWQSLRLVLVPSAAGTWYLVGVIHDQWTI